MINDKAKTAAYLLAQLHIKVTPNSATEFNYRNWQPILFVEAKN